MRIGVLGFGSIKPVDPITLLEMVKSPGAKLHRIVPSIRWMLGFVLGGLNPEPKTA